MSEVNNREWQDRLMTLDDLASMLPTHSKSTIYRWVRDGRLPFAIKIGARWVFRQSDVLAWLDGMRMG